MWAQTKEEQLGTYFNNLNRNLEQAETYEEYIELSRRLSLLEHKRECQEVRNIVSRGTRPHKYDPDTTRKMRRDVQEYCALLNIPVLRIKNSSPMAMSDNRTGEDWYFSFASNHPTNLKVNFT